MVENWWRLSAVFHSQLNNKLSMPNQEKTYLSHLCRRFCIFSALISHPTGSNSWNRSWWCQFLWWDSGSDSELVECCCIQSLNLGSHYKDLAVVFPWDKLTISYSSTIWNFLGFPQWARSSALSGIRGNPTARSTLIFKKELKQLLGGEKFDFLP